MLGATLRAATTASGSASTAAAVVPIAAIATVSANRTRCTGNSRVAGGHAFTAHDAILGSPVRSLPGSSARQAPARPA